jgi:hypothetical protein
MAPPPPGRRVTFDEMTHRGYVRAFDDYRLHPGTATATALEALPAVMSAPACRLTSLSAWTTSTT